MCPEIRVLQQNVSKKYRPKVLGMLRWETKLIDWRT